MVVLYGAAPMQQKTIKQTALAYRISNSFEQLSLYLLGNQKLLIATSVIRLGCYLKVLAGNFLKTAQILSNVLGYFEN